MPLKCDRPSTFEATTSFNFSTKRGNRWYSFVRQCWMIRSSSSCTSSTHLNGIMHTYGRGGLNICFLPNRRFFQTSYLFLNEKFKAQIRHENSRPWTGWIFNRCQHFEPAQPLKRFNPFKCSTEGLMEDIIYSGTTGEFLKDDVAGSVNGSLIIARKFG